MQQTPHRTPSDTINEQPDAGGGSLRNRISYRMGSVHLEVFFISAASRPRVCDSLRSVIFLEDPEVDLVAAAEVADAGEADRVAALDRLVVGVVG